MKDFHIDYFSFLLEKLIVKNENNFTFKAARESKFTLKEGQVTG